jgi:acyl carrier protein
MKAPSVTTLNQLLVTKYEVAQDDLQPERTLDDLGVDSLAIIELIDDIGNAFGIALDDVEALNKTMTVAEVMSLIEAKQTP